MYVTGVRRQSRPASVCGFLGSCSSGVYVMSLDHSRFPFVASDRVPAQQPVDVQMNTDLQSLNSNWWS